MDWDNPSLKELTIDVSFKRNGKAIYRATTWAGHAGIYTGMRLSDQGVGGYTVSLNYRKPQSSTHWNIFANLYCALRRSWSSSLLIRHTLDTQHFYSDALDAFAKTSLIAPCYFILSGSVSGEGAIVNRDRFGEDRRLELGKVPGCHFLVQTNIDHWVDKIEKKWAEDDALLLTSLQRKVAAEESMRQLTNFSEAGCKAILTKSPVLDLETIYSTIMSVAHETFINYIPHQEFANLPV